MLDNCDYRLALEHGSKLGADWQCANMTRLRPGPECSNIFNTCHTLLDLTGPLQLGALPGDSTDSCRRSLNGSLLAVTMLQR